VARENPGGVPPGSRLPNLLADVINIMRRHRDAWLVGLMAALQCILTLAAAPNRAAPNPYDVLGVQRDADALEIRRAYKRAALRCHPDRGGSAADFEAVNEAFSVLSDDSRKRQYDATSSADAARPAWDQAGRRTWTVPLACTLRELAGYDPVPLMLTLAHAGLPVYDALRLGVPIEIYLTPGAAAGDQMRVRARIPIRAGSTSAALATCASYPAV
jgi:hypothetical protein